jgi:hypothetical protein
MAVEKRRKKRPVGRPKLDRKKPVVSTRVTEEIFDKICAAADEHKMSIAAETEHRINLSFEWERQRLEYLALIQNADRLEAFIGEMNWPSRIAFTKAGEPVKVWAKRGTDIDNLKIGFDTNEVLEAIKPELAELLAKGIKKVMEGDK